MSERQNMCNFLKSQVRRNTGYHLPFRTDLGGGYPPLLGKNYTPLENLQISVKIEKWARFGMAAHLCFVYLTIPRTKPCVQQGKKGS